MKRTLLGIGLILLAGFLLFKEQLRLAQLPIWTVIWVAFLTFGAISQLAKHHFILGTVLAICSFAQLNDIFHWVNITSWLLMLVTILVGLGLTLIFKGTNPSRYGNSIFSYYNNQTSFENDKMVKHLNKGMSKVFGGFSRYINDNHFSNDSVDVLLGSATVYFDGAEIEGEQATYTVDAVFSYVTIYLPCHWRVEVVGDHVFSSVNQAPTAPETEKVLVIVADLVFSGIEIHYL